MRVSRLWSSRSPLSSFLRHLEWSRRYCGSQLYKRASVAIACEYSHLSSLSFCQQRRLYSQAILARKWSKTYPYICANPVISVDPNWVLNSWNWLPSTRRANTYKITKSHKMRFLHTTWNKTSKTTNNLATFWKNTPFAKTASFKGGLPVVSQESCFATSRFATKWSRFAAKNSVFVFVFVFVCLVFFFFCGGGVLEAIRKGKKLG